MPWRIAYLDDLHAVEMNFSGTVSPAELTDCVTTALEQARVTGTRRFLCDATQLAGGHSVFDLYALAENLHTLGLPVGAREAIIVPVHSERAREANFWENTCANRGFEVRCFATREEAVAWLRDEALTLTGT